MYFKSIMLCMFGWSLMADFYGDTFTFFLFFSLGFIIELLLKYDVLSILHTRDSTKIERSVAFIFFGYLIGTAIIGTRVEFEEYIRLVSMYGIFIYFTLNSFSWGKKLWL